MQASIAAGTTLKATVSLTDYPASAGWVLHYRLALRSGSGTPIDIVGTASGDGHQVTVAHGTTANWPAGTYTVNAWVDNGTDRFSVSSESGQIIVTPNPATLAAGVDQRSAAVINLAAVQALLGGKAASGMERYAINGRELRSYPLADLIKLEAKLKAEVNAELASAGRAPLYNSGRIRPILMRLG